MKKLMLLALWHIAPAFTTSAAMVVLTFETSFEESGNIPDGNPNPWSDTRTVSDMLGLTIANLTVQLNISGGYNGDLYAYLSHNGTLVPLMNRVGVSTSDAFGYGDAGANIRFTDSAPHNIHVYQSVSGYSITGGAAWQPDGRTINPVTSSPAAFDAPGTLTLGSFQGLEPNGDWTLVIADVAAGGGQATVSSWGMEITTVPEPAHATVVAFALLLAAGARRRFARAGQRPTPERSPALRISFRRYFSVLVALLTPFTANSEPMNPIAGPGPQRQHISWAELGEKATAQYSGGGLGISRVGNGAIQLRCVLQKLAGEVTTAGLCLNSTLPGTESDRLSVVTDYVGRDGGAMVALNEGGAAYCNSALARFVRPNLVEEYTVSADGIRQDILVLERPSGAGPLRVELAVKGAQAKSAAGGARLALSQSRRELIYSQLRVVEQSGRLLDARLEVVSEERLAIIVEDARATYPVRIDPTFSDANWVSLGGLPGTSQTVYAVAVDGLGGLYVGGQFTTAGSVAANRVAKWDGNAWSALGSGLDNQVEALVVSGTNVYAGGLFSNAGGSPASRIAKWDGNAWSALGSGMNNAVYDLAMVGTDLYAGGAFLTAGGANVNYIAKWNGTHWSDLASGMNGQVRALAVSGTNLYAGGIFTVAGGNSAQFVAKWNGTAWSALGSPGLNNYVFALAVSETNLYAAGDFITANGTTVNRVAKWDGSAWSALGAGVNNRVYAIMASGSDVYVGGDFTTAGTGLANHIAKWNGTAWSTMGAGIYYVYALAAAGTDLYVGGWFTSLDGVGACNIAQWNGNAWSALGSGMNAEVKALVVSGTDLIAGGNFVSAGGVAVNRVAKWNGSSWSALGSGTDTSVAALAVSGADLYAGFDFVSGGGVTTGRVAQWNGTSWSALGSGMNNSVLALGVGGTNLYAGGMFTVAGGTAAARIAKWNGSAWSALGSGVDSFPYAFAELGTDLYVGGWFANAGGSPVNYIAKWNGTTWSALGSGMNALVYALAVSGTNLYAGGIFTLAGGVTANRIAKWNGTAWSALGSGMNQTVSALSFAGADLYAGGAFTTAGGVAANRIARWDGNTWSALGSGMNNGVNALAAAAGVLYAGGSFTSAGNQVSGYVAKGLLGIVANNATYTRSAGLSLKIRIADIAWDSTGAAVTVQALGPSSRGATLNFNSTYLFYLPADNNDDSFAYTVSNGSDTATGVISIVVSSSPGGLAKTIAVSEGAATIKFFGIPGLTYGVQRTPSLSAPVTWTTLTGSGLPPGADGSFTFTDASAPPGTAYYRSFQQ